MPYHEGTLSKKEEGKENTRNSVRSKLNAENVT